MSIVRLSKEETEYVRQGFEAGVRADGRGVFDFREIDIITDVVSQATGSARVRLGSTEVLVGVKAEVGSPQEDAPNLGRVAFAVEFSPVASPAFRGRGGNDLAGELTAVLERAFFAGHGASFAGIDLGALCIVPGKSCWILFVDVLVLSVGGSVEDAASMAIKAALATTLLPRVELIAGEDPDDEPDYALDDDPSVSVSLDVTRTPLTLTVAQVGSALAIDLDEIEDVCSTATVAVSVDPEGQVFGMTKKGDGGLQPETILSMVDIGAKRGSVLHAALDKFIQKEKAM